MMENQKKAAAFDEKAFADFLRQAVDAVKFNEDLETMKKIRKAFRKAVPMGMRSYVGAYLAKRCGAGFRRNAAASDGRHEFAPKPPAQRLDIPEELAANLFFSMGKSRRVFPRDIIEFVTKNSSLPRERIGKIRTCLKYTFVQVYREDADNLIASLNGKEFRGLQMTVSYSKSKIDSEGESAGHPQVENAG